MDGEPEDNFPNPKENWRLKILSVPRVRTEKYVPPPDVLDTGIRPEALKGPLKPRDAQMSIPPLRKLYLVKQTYAHNPIIKKNFNDVMDKQITRGWNNIYNEYRKARREKHLAYLATKKGKRGRGKAPVKAAKGKGKAADTHSMNSAEWEKHMQEWVEKSAQPKPVPEPEKIDRGPIVNLDDIKDDMDAMATPLHVTEKYVEPPPPAHIVKESALNYVPTERVLGLATIPARYLVKEPVFIPGAVKKGALLHKPTEYDNKMSVPRARASANDADLKEDPFSISKNALKYKASPRIIELAKPRQVS